MNLRPVLQSHLNNGLTREMVKYVLSCDRLNIVIICSNIKCVVELYLYRDKLITAMLKICSYKTESRHQQFLSIFCSHWGSEEHRVIY